MPGLTDKRTAGGWGHLRIVLLVCRDKSWNLSALLLVSFTQTLEGSISKDILSYPKYIPQIAKTRLKILPVLTCEAYTALVWNLSALLLVSFTQTLEESISKDIISYPISQKGYNIISYIPKRILYHILYPKKDIISYPISQKGY
jgi:hypothetical protein